MHPLSYIAIAVICFVCAGLFEQAERQSRRWYQDRMMMRGSGFFLAIGVVMVLMAFF